MIQCKDFFFFAGTVISEYDAGVAIWEQILSSDESVDDIVEALVRVAVAFKFDGWLLNIENTVDSEKVSSLKR